MNLISKITAGQGQFSFFKHRLWMISTKAFVFLSGTSEYSGQFLVGEGAFEMVCVALSCEKRRKWRFMCTKMNNKADQPMHS